MWQNKIETHFTDGTTLIFFNMTKEREMTNLLINELSALGVKKYQEKLKNIEKYACIIKIIDKKLYISTYMFWKTYELNNIDKEAEIISKITNIKVQKVKKLIENYINIRMIEKLSKKQHE